MSHIALRCVEITINVTHMLKIILITCSKNKIKIKQFLELIVFVLLDHIKISGTPWEFQK